MVAWATIPIGAKNLGSITGDSSDPPASRIFRAGVKLQPIPKDATGKATVTTSELARKFVFWISGYF